MSCAWGRISPPHRLGHKHFTAVNEGRTGDFARRAIRAGVLIRVCRRRRDTA